jgi:hypothetical protein
MDGDSLREPSKRGAKQTIRRHHSHLGEGERGSFPLFQISSFGALNIVSFSTGWGGKGDGEEVCLNSSVWREGRGMSLL